MTLEQRTDLRLTQKLALTPQLQLQLKLLQLPQLELGQYIELQLMENPLLELDEEIENTENEIISDEQEDSVFVDKIEKIMVDEYFAERADDGRDLGYFNPGIEEKPSFELFYSETADLWEHLLWQLRLSNAPDKIRTVAEIVIGNIDEDGYLKATDEEIIAFSSTDPETVKSAIKLVQGFDPPGVCARDIKECLILQLKNLGLGETVVQYIVEQHLEDIQKKRYEKIYRKFNISVEDVIKAVKMIEKLEPRPGRNLTRHSVTL
jgi:RNA polymerase sigma-54 factor